MRSTRRLGVCDCWGCCARSAAPRPTCWRPEARRSTGPVRQSSIAFAVAGSRTLRARHPRRPTPADGRCPIRPITNGAHPPFRNAAAAAAGCQPRGNRLQRLRLHPGRRHPFGRGRAAVGTSTSRPGAATTRDTSGIGDHTAAERAAGAHRAAMGSGRRSPVRRRCRGPSVLHVFTCYTCSRVRQAERDVERATRASQEGKAAGGRSGHVPVRAHDRGPRPHGGSGPPVRSGSEARAGRHAIGPIARDGRPGDLDP